MNNSTSLSAGDQVDSSLAALSRKVCLNDFSKFFIILPKASKLIENCILVFLRPLRAVWAARKSNVIEF